MNDANTQELSGAEAEIAVTNPTFAANLQKAKELPAELQTHVTDRVVDLQKRDGLSVPEALALALSEVPHQPTTDELLELSRDTPDAAEDHARGVEIATQLHQTRIAEMTDIATRLARPSEPDEDRFSRYTGYN